MITLHLLNHNKWSITVVHNGGGFNFPSDHQLIVIPETENTIRLGEFLNAYPDDRHPILETLCALINRPIITLCNGDEIIKLIRKINTAGAMRVLALITLSNPSIKVPQVNPINHTIVQCALEIREIMKRREIKSAQTTRLP